MSNRLNLKPEINKRIVGYANPVEFYIEKLTEGISTLAAAFLAKTCDCAHVRF